MRAPAGRVRDRGRRHDPPEHRRAAPGWLVSRPRVGRGGFPGDRGARSRRRAARRGSGRDPRGSALNGRPLGGRVVVVTRPADGTSTLTDLLRAEGATVLEAPAIEILPADDTEPLDDAVAELSEGGFAWVVFSSPRAVDAVCERMDALRLR